MKNILRWIAIPFVAILSSLLIHILCTLWIGQMQSYNGINITSITDIILSIIRDLSVGGMFVYAGAMIAPKANKIVSVILATIACIMCIISFVSNILTHGGFMTYIGIVATLIGAIVGSIKVNEEIEE